MTLTEEILDGIISMRLQIIMITMCLCVPSLILFVCQLFTILWNKEFHNSFYALFAIRAIMVCFYGINAQKIVEIKACYIKILEVNHLKIN